MARWNTQTLTPKANRVELKSDDFSVVCAALLNRVELLGAAAEFCVLCDMSRQSRHRSDPGHLLPLNSAFMSRTMRPVRAGYDVEVVYTSGRAQRFQ